MKRTLREDGENTGLPDVDAEATVKVVTITKN